MDVAAYARTFAGTQGIGPDVIRDVTCTPPATRPTGDTVLCELIPQQVVDPAFVAIRVVDAAADKADAVLVTGGTTCDSLPPWALALRDQTSKFYCI